MPQLLEAVTTTCCALPHDEQSPCAEEQVGIGVGDTGGGHRGVCGGCPGQENTWSMLLTPPPSISHSLQLSQQIDALCAAQRSSWRDPRGCCAWGGPERLRCFEGEYLQGVMLGAAIPPPAFA